MAGMTVVIPTFNRGPLLAATVECVQLSQLDGIGEVEIIIVDDGSTPPAQGHLHTLSAGAPFTLRVLRQENAGPAAARNTGFRQATGGLVLFMDDDILPQPGLLQRHVEVHKRFPGSVVFGPYPFAPAPETPLRSFVNGFQDFSGAEPFTQAGIVASGQLSVERAQFASWGAVYRDDLRVPGAEEFELSFRLRTLGIPIIMFSSVLATHNQPVELEPIRSRQFKYGLGIAEAAAKCPELQQMPEFSAILTANQPLKLSDSPKEAVWKLAKATLRHPSISSLAEMVLAFVERLFPKSRLLTAGYHTLLGASLYGGLYQGRRQYGAPSS